MARPRTDPKIRQNAFIDAARGLFFSKGYEDTSIRDILDAVGENAISPSVFYYYFESKETLYQAVMEDYIDHYIAGLQETLADDSHPIETRMAILLNEMLHTLLESQPAIQKGASIQNRFFILDLHERISQRVISLWEEAILEMPWVNPDSARELSRFITGGICSLIYNFVFGSSSQQEATDSLAHAIIRLSMTLLNAPKPIQKRFITAYNNL
jgi:AcrR family transcriptional regulator